MMDPTRSPEMPSCSATDLAEMRRFSKIRSWIWSVIWFFRYFLFLFFSFSHFANMYVYVCIPLLRLLVICFLGGFISNLHWLLQFPFHPLTSNNPKFLHHTTEDFSLHTLFPY
jgi:hypothetical protein